MLRIPLVYLDHQHQDNIQYQILVSTSIALQTASLLWDQNPIEVKEHIVSEVPRYGPMGIPYIEKEYSGKLIFWKPITHFVE